MTYTIKGKEYTEFDIKKRCAELLGFELTEFSNINVGRQWCIKESVGDDWVPVRIPDYLKNPADTWSIIEKCWDELHKTFVDHSHKTSESFKEIDFGKIITKWQSIIIEHNCSPLVAACIYFIEINERK